MRPCCACSIPVVLLTVIGLSVHLATTQSLSFIRNVKQPSLLPLERQRKSVERDLSRLFRSPLSRRSAEARPTSVFRERQRQLDRQWKSGRSGIDDSSNDQVDLPKYSHGTKSIFSERRRPQNLLRNDLPIFDPRGRNAAGSARRKNRKRTSSAKGFEDPFDEQRPLPDRKRRGKLLNPDDWDPRFPGLNLPDKRESSRDDRTQINWTDNDGQYLEFPEDQAVNDILERFAWKNMEKRLTLLSGQDGQYHLDRGERRRRVQRKRNASASTGPAVGRDELEAIMGDETSQSALNDGQKNDKNAAEMQKKLPKSDSVQLIKRTKKPKWDDYFGIDKRSASPALDDGGGDDDDDEDDSSAQQLERFLVNWYVRKMLERAKEEQLDEDDLDEEYEENDVMRKDGRGRDPLRNVDERLRRLEDVVLLKASNLLQNDVVDPGDAPHQADGEFKEFILEHLKAAYSLEKMRSDLREFQKSLIKMKMFDSVLEDDSKKRKKCTDCSGTLSEKPTDIEESPSTAVTVAAADDATSESCPLWIEAVDYCDDLGQALGDVGLALTSSCVEHMICHTCDQHRSCDRQYLSRAAEACGDDFRCQATAGAMRSVFLTDGDVFRRRNRIHCMRDDCRTKPGRLGPT